MVFGQITSLASALAIKILLKNHLFMENCQNYAQINQLTDCY